jgi:LysR family transcriptional regulator, transcriptional activator of nhaA
MSHLNYGHLQYFWAVAREGHLTRAAESLHVSQSAVSAQIRRLEESLGCRLFERVGRRMVLTDAGQRALDHADAIFGIGQRLQRAVQGAGAARQMLRVGAHSTLSRNFQLAFLSPVLGRADVTVSIRTGPLPALSRMLGRHQIDVLLASSLPPRDDATPWIAERVASQPVNLVAHPARLRGARDWRRLIAEEPLVAPTADSVVRAGFDLLTTRLGIVPTFAAEVDDMAMLRLLARNDVGLGVVPSIVVRDELAAGVLVEAARLPGLREDFYALRLPREFPHPLVAALTADARTRLARDATALRRARGAASRGSTSRTPASPSAPRGRG